MNARYRSILLLLIAPLYIIITALPSWAKERITLQLNWSQPAHLAGYYVALKKGFYAKEGLDVSLKKAEKDTNVVDEVLSGRAQYGIGTNGIMIDRQQGKPIVVLAVIYQQSSHMLVTAYRSPDQNIQEIRGKDVMIGPDAQDILAYLKMEGLEGQYNIVKHLLDRKDLINGRVYAMTIDCPHPLEELKKAGFKYQIYSPHTVGIDFYGDNLFTNQAELRNRPNRVKSFIKASLMGWQYVTEHPQEAAELLSKEHPDSGDTEKFLHQINGMLPYIKSNIVPIGFMHEGRWRFIADTLTKLGILKEGFSLEGFLYAEPKPVDLKPIIIASLIALTILMIALYIISLNRKLHQKVNDLNIALKNLAESERRYRMLAEHTTDVIWTLDLKGRFTYVSPSVKRLRGYTPEEVMSQPTEEALTEQSRHHFLEGMKRIQDTMAQGDHLKDHIVELEQPCKDGSTVWTEAIINGMYDDAGRLIGIVGVTRDISQRRKTEMRLRNLYDAIEQLPLGVVIADKTGSIEYVNRRFIGMTDMTKELFDTYDYKSLINSMGEMVKEEIWADLMAGCNWQTERLCKDGLGREYWESIIITPVSDALYNTTHFISTHRDISERKQIEQELESARQDAIMASKAKGDFLANMSHEIRTPLHSIIGYTELLSGMPLTREARDYLENMKSAESALLCLINDILDFSKIESGKMSLYVEEINIITLLEQTIDTVCLQAYQKGLELIFAIAPDMPNYAFVDAVRLRQILINLLSNAVKFTERGEVELKVFFRETDDSKGTFHFSVRDTGIGISEEYQRQIFDSFIQVENSATRQYSGTGLGLAISERLANMMGSQIHLESKPSEGSVFSLSIETGYRKDTSEVPSLASLKALVICKNDTLRGYLKELLTLAGIHSQDCSSDSVAIETAISCPDIDLLVVDYKIFKEEGLDRLREIIHHLQKTTTDLRIILLLDPSTIIDSRYAPAWLNSAIHLFKPVKLSRLYEILQICMGNKEDIPKRPNDIPERRYNDAPIKILVIEDVPMNMIIMKKLISRIVPHSRLFKATNGREAIEQYMARLPDLIFMDVQMPEMDGISATRIIREKEAALQRRSTIVALTAGTTETERHRCMEVDMDHFLSKPIDIRALREILINTQMSY